MSMDQPNGAPFPPFAPPNGSGNSFQPVTFGSSPTPTKPRIWTVFLTIALSFAAYLAVSIGAAVALLLVYLAQGGDMAKVESGDFMNEMSTSPLSLWFLVLPGQLAILFVTIGAVLASPQPFLERLSLKEPRWPIFATVLAVLATPLWSFLWSIPLSQMFEQSEHLEMMVEMFQANGTGLQLVGLLLCVALTPAIAEEWLYRGYVQSRLTQRWHPIFAVGLSSILFAGMHMDPIHVLAVIPLGFWLGYITYRCGSIVPAMIAHFYNNALSIFGVLYDQGETLDVSLTSVTNLIVICLGAPAALLLLGYLFVTGLKPKYDPRIAN